MQSAKKSHLTHEETMELIQASQAGDSEAVEILTQKNMRLIWSVVQRFKNRGCDLDDLFQIGSIGFMKCLQKFDTSYNVRFSTYAVPMIIGEIQRFLRDDGTIKVSRSIKEAATQIRIRFKDIPLKELDARLVAEELEIELHQVKLAIGYMLEAYAPKSVHEVVYENDGDPIRLEDQLTEGSNWFDHMALREAMDKLDEREKLIVHSRYFQDQTQTEVAAALDISQVQVSRLEKKILDKIRDNFEEKDTKPVMRIPFNVVQFEKYKKDKREEKEMVTETKVRGRKAKGDVEKAIMLLRTTKLTYDEIYMMTDVNKAKINKLAKEHRPEHIRKQLRTEAMQKARAARGTEQGKENVVKEIKVPAPTFSAPKKEVKPEAPNPSIGEAINQFHEETRQEVLEEIKSQAQVAATSETPVQVQEPQVRKPGISTSFSYAVSGYEVGKDEGVAHITAALDVLKMIPEGKKITFDIKIES